MLGNGKIYLRAPEPEDLDMMFRWENTPELWEAGNIVAPVSRQLLHDYISAYEADIFVQRQLRFVVVEKVGGNPVGAVDLADFDPVNRRAQAGILISAEYRGKGYGLDALTLTADYCRNRIGMYQLYSIVATDNEISQALFEKAGYTESGLLRGWLRRGNSYLDAIIYQLIL